MRKYITIVLTAILALSNVVIYANENTARYEKAYEGKELLCALGIDVGISPEEATEITRSDFLLTLTKLFGMGIITNTETSYADVENGTDLASAVRFACDAGIISKSDNFYPTRSVTYNEAYKMILSALGYQAEALYEGGYPTGYYVVATQLNLNKGVLNKTDTLSACDFYVLLFNTLNTKVRRAISVTVSETHVSMDFESSQTVLELYFNIFKVKGIVEGNEISCLYSTEYTAPSGYIFIDGIKYLGDYKKYPLGCRVNGYAQTADSGDNKIIYLSTDQNSTVLINSEQNPKLQNGSLICYDENGKNKEFHFADETAVIFAGKSYMKYNSSDFEINDGYIVAIDNNGDNKYDAFHIYESNFISVDKVDYSSNTIYDRNNVRNIYLGGQDVEYIIKDMTLDDISSGMYLEYYVSKDGKYYEIEIISNSVDGIIENIDNSGNKLTLNDKEYGLTQYFKNINSKVEAGTEVTAILSKNGKLVAIEGVIGSEYRYGYLFASEQNENGVDKFIRVKLLAEDGTLRVFKLAKNIIFNYDRKTDLYVYVQISANQQLIRYKVNSEGKISCIFTQNSEEGTLENNEDDGKILKRFRFEGDDTENKIYYKITGYFVPYFTISSTTKIFIALNNNGLSDEKRYYLGKGKDFLANDTLVPSNEIRVYNVNSNGVAGAIVYMPKSSYDTPVSTEASSGIIAKAVYALNPDGEIAVKLVMYSNDKYKTYYINTDEEFYKRLQSANGGDSIPFNIGDYIRYNADTYGFITNAVVDFNGKSREILTVDSRHNIVLNYYYGEVRSIGDGTLSVILNGKTLYFTFGMKTCGFVDKDGNVSTIPVSNIITKAENPDSCNKILIKSRYAGISEAIIFE